MSFNGRVELFFVYFCPCVYLTYGWFSLTWPSVLWDSNDKGHDGHVGAHNKRSSTWPPWCNVKTTYWFENMWLDDLVNCLIPDPRHCVVLFASNLWACLFSFRHFQHSILRGRNFGTLCKMMQCKSPNSSTRSIPRCNWPHVEHNHRPLVASDPPCHWTMCRRTI